MGFPKRQAAIVGVYNTEQGKLPDRTSFSLQLEAIRGALDDAGMTLDDIDGLLPMSGSTHVAGFDGPTAAHQFWAEQLGGRPISLMEVGGASGQLAKAAAAISAGMCETAVLFYGKAGRPVGPRGSARPDRAPRVGRMAVLDPRGVHDPVLRACGLSATWTSSRSPPRISPRSRSSTVTTPPSTRTRSWGAGGRSPSTTCSTRAGSPNRCTFSTARSTPTAGYAVVMTTAERARSARQKPVYVLGGAEAVYTDFYVSFSEPWFGDEGKSIRKAADRAFSLAGVSRDDVDVVGSYDCFTVTGLRNLEEMGFCGIGEGADYVREGHTRLGGKMPVNTDGGLLSGSHPGDPSGLMVTEVVKQLRGECGARQVANAKIGVAPSAGLRDPRHR